MNTRAGGAGEPETRLEVVISERRQLIGLAYRHGVPRRAGVDDAGRASRVRPPRRLPVLLRRGGRDRGADTGCLPAVGLLGSPPTSGVAAIGTPPAQQTRLVREFKQAWEARDITALVGLLDPGARMAADGGGNVSARLAPLHGGEQVARYLVQVLDRVPELTLVECPVNQRPGLVARHDGVPLTVFAFELSGDRITRIWAVRNPDKLGSWRPRI